MGLNTTRRGLLASAAGLTAAACAPTQDVMSKPAAVASDAMGALDGVAMAARVRSGEIKPLELVDAAIARAEKANPQINAIVTPLFERAREQAKGAKPTGPLAGVPTFIKDLDDLKGAPTKYGCRAFANNIATGQAAYVEAVLAGGVVPLGKSTTPEFGLTATTEPLLGGATKNPWNTAHSSGGSSGGAAALVAAGVVPVAHASDGGGSIRIPASCCGLFGLKPSRGRTAPDGDAPSPVDISVHCAVSRTVRDTAAWLAMTERTGADQVFTPVGFIADPTKRKLKIALMTADLLGREPDPEVKAATEAAAKLCASLGHEIVTPSLKFDGAAFSQAFTLYWAGGAAQVEAAVRRNMPAGAKIEDLLEPLTLRLSALAQSAPKDAMPNAIATLKAAERAYRAAFADFDVLLTPVLAKPPVKLGVIAPDAPFDSMWAAVNAYVGYTPLENAAGAAAMSVPLGWSRAGLPIGAHFAADQGQEALLLGLAYQLEQAQPWIQRKPQVWVG
jgi:amidase